MKNENAQTLSAFFIEHSISFKCSFNNNETEFVVGAYACKNIYELLHSMKEMYGFTITYGYGRYWLKLCEVEE